MPALKLFRNWLGSTKDTSEVHLIFQNVSREGQIKAIVKTNGVACHPNAPADVATIPLTTFEAVKMSWKKNLIMRVNSPTNAMPPNGLMPKDARRIFDAWVTQGLKDN